MKIGINRWTLPPHLPLAECFTLVAQAGFDSIEINIAEDGELTPATDEQGVKALVALRNRRAWDCRACQPG